MFCARLIGWVLVWGLAGAAWADEARPRASLLVTWAGGGFEAAAVQAKCSHWRRLGARPVYRVFCEGSLNEAAERWASQGARVELPQIEQDAEDACDAPEPPLDPALWHLENRGQPVGSDPGLAGADIGALAAWERGLASCDAVLVAVPDTGIWAEHPSLAGALWENPGEVCGDGLDNDANGFIDDCQGWDFGMDDPNPSPLTLAATKPDGSPCRVRHATFMAGLIAGQGAATGVCRGGARLMNLKKHDDATCTSTTADSAEALAYALDHGARVVVLAFSFQGYSEALDSLLAEAAAAGVVVVMPAGNYAEDADSVERYPVHFGHPGSLVVAASDHHDALTAESSWGASRVHLTAPGWVLTSADLGPLTGRASGTSYAAGLAAGIVAQVLATPLTPQQALNAIIQGAERRPWLDCAQSARCVAAGGRIDLEGALSVALGPNPPKPLCQDPPDTHAPDPEPPPSPDETSEPTQNPDTCGCAQPRKQRAGWGLMAGVGAVLCVGLCVVAFARRGNALPQGRKAR